MWNLCYSDFSGKETWINTDDFSQLFEEAERVSLVHGTRIVACGHALPLSVPADVRRQAQEVVDLVFRFWEESKTSLNN